MIKSGGLVWLLPCLCSFFAGPGSCKPTLAAKPKGCVTGFEASCPDKLPFATLSRSACFGNCPQYKLSVYLDGTVEWEGLQHVQAKGTGVVAKLAPSKLAAIRAAFTEAHYMELEGDFECSDLHDLPALVTSYFDGTREKSIAHRCDRHPDARKLSRLEEKLEKLLGSERWVGTPQERDALERLNKRDTLRQELKQGERFHLVPILEIRHRLRPAWIEKGVPTVQGAMSVDQIERIVQRQMRDLDSCQYEMSRPKYRSEKGDMTVRFRISMNGDIVAAAVKSSTLKNSSVAACILARVKNWVALPPPGGHAVEVSLPLHVKGEEISDNVPAVPSSQQP